MPRPFSTDHQVIGVRFAVTAMGFLLVGLALMLLVRWQLAYPGQPIPVVGRWLGSANAPGGIMTPEFYNQLGAMHGTIMIFLGVVPLAVGGFGTYLIPLMLGARNLAFPRMSVLGFWCYAAAGLVMLSSFVVTGGAANNGWTSYPPLSVLSVTSGQTLWLIGMLLVGVSSTLGAVTTIVSIVQLRAPGLTFMRMPFFLWAQLVTAFLLLLAFPPLEVAALMQLMDRVAGSSFFLPSGLVVGGQAIPYAGGGNPLLWQHLFWFLAHPEVYVLVLPAMGIVAEVLAVNIRKPLWGYRLMVGAALFLGFMSMLVWAHHMFLTGMGTTMSAFFQTTTMIVSIPSVVIVSALLLSLHGGSIRFTTASLFALAFLPMFAIGGLTGLPLGLAATDIHLHDTYYVIGHFHYLVAPGTIFALFAGVYHWYPRVTGRRLSERLGKIHFWGSLVCMNAVFFPMFIQGLAGLNRRLYDGGITYAHGQAIQHWNVVQGWAAWALGLVQIAFFVNLLISRRAATVGANPWRATTLEWLEPTNQAASVRVFRGPYEYSVPGRVDDFVPQHTPDRVEPGRFAHGTTWNGDARADTGTTNLRLATWLFIASEVMLFGGLFSALVLLRAGDPTWSGQSSPLALPWGLAAVIVVVAATVLLEASARSSDLRRWPSVGWVVTGLAVALVGARAVECFALLGNGFRPSTGNFWALFYLFAVVHSLHVIAGAVFVAALIPGTPLDAGAAPGRSRDRIAAAARYWQFVALVSIAIFVALYLV